ncbi:MAG: hypothetical protein HYT80_04815 [Euryarchaeota archaeon]|nr:hypothetical protein [Euryarchaeota archaeon]
MVEFRWDVAAFLLVFAVIVAILIRMSMRARQAEAQQTMSQESPGEKMLLRFVEDEKGTRVGETVAVEADKMIVKAPGGFLAIPVAQLSESGPGLKLTGTFDEAAAKKEGEAWREKSHKVITYDPKELPPDEQADG